MNMQQETGHAVLTVGRGMQVLRAFRSDRAPLTNAELVQRTGLPKATVSRLTTTLLQLGFLTRVADGRGFEIGPAALAVGHSLVASSELLEIANPLLQELADRLDATAGLAVGHDMDMLYIGYRAGQRVATLRLGVGSILPMASTATGHAFLWAQSVAEQRRLIAQIRQQAGKQAPEVENGIRKSFDDLASSGTCGIVSHLRHTYGVALPVRVGRQKVVMSVSCGKALLNLDLLAERNRVAPHLKKLAFDLQESLATIDGPF